MAQRVKLASEASFGVGRLTAHPSTRQVTSVSERQTVEPRVMQVLVALVTLTLFIPCVANYFIMIKERGWKWAIGLIFVVLIGPAVSLLLNRSRRDGDRHRPGPGGGLPS